MAMSPSDCIEILVVESRSPHAEAACRACAALRFNNRPHIVTRREDALDFLYQQGAYGDAPVPDVIFIDPAVSERNGWSLFAEIKADERLRNIPVVIQTTGADEAEQMRQCRINDRFIVKPWESEALAGVIGSIDQLSPMVQASQAS
jgi:two-component system response regulator